MWSIIGDPNTEQNTCMPKEDYDLIDDRSAKLVKLDVKVSGEAVDALSLIVHEADSYKQGSKLCKRLKKEINNVRNFRNFNYYLFSIISFNHPYPKPKRRWIIFFIRRWCKPNNGCKEYY